MEPNVLTDAIQAKSGIPPHKPVSAQLVNSGMDMPASSVQTEEPGTSTLNLANAQFHQPGTELHVSPVLEVEFTTMSPTNVNAQVAKPTTDSSAPSTAQPVNSTMKLSRDVLAHLAKTGTETSVSSVSVDKPGMPPSTLVSVQATQSGTDTHASTHAQEEESWMLSVDSVSAQLVTGMEPPVLSAQTPKSGQPQDYHAFVLMETGTALLASSAQPIKFGSQPP
jgi:hypothetical protein